MFWEGKAFPMQDAVLFVRVVCPTHCCRALKE